MALIIRLQRVGKKKQPVFRIALTEKHKSAKKTAKEVLGHYNPRTKEFAIKSEERLRHWIEERVPLSATVHNLFVAKGILSGNKVRAWVPKKKSAQGGTEGLSQVSPEAGIAAAAETKAEAPTEVQAEEQKQEQEKEAPPVKETTPAQDNPDNAEGKQE